MFLQQWKEAAITLDEYLDFQAWKKTDEDPFYDWKLVRKASALRMIKNSRFTFIIKVKRSLRSLRENNDVRGCLGVLETCIRSNFAGVESARYAS